MHFNHLYKEINFNEKKVGIVHIYSEYPDYDFEIEPKEGFTCVDDVARAIGAPLFCAPKKYRMTADQFISEFSRIPKERRQIQSVRDAWREIVIRRVPC